MNNRLKSLLATVLIQGTLGYVFIMALAMSGVRDADHAVTSINLAPKRAPPPPPVVRPAPRAMALHPAPTSFAGRAVILHDWASAGPVQRNLDFMKATKWVQDNLPEEDKRLIRWRADLPQGSGPAKVTRLRPANLPTHTLYWPANWAKGPLPIVAWGNGRCNNSSLAYAAFLSEIASHGYFVVAVGNDDIDYPQPEGLEVLADGRPVHTQAAALTRAVDWAVAENSRAGGPYAGKIAAGKVAYMGQGCGGEQAMRASADPRTTTTVLLNSAAVFRPGPAAGRKPPVAEFEGQQDERAVLEASAANLARARTARWPLVRAARGGLSGNGAYAGPDRAWSAAVVAWLDWQLKGDSSAEARFNRMTGGGWSRENATAGPPPGAP